MSEPGVPAGVDEHVRTELVRFVRALRRAGASVPANAATTAAQALGEVGLADRTRVRTALRASLLTDSEDFERFDRLFETFWRRLTLADGEGSPLDDFDENKGVAPLGVESPDVADAEPATDRDDDGAAAEGEESVSSSLSAPGSAPDEVADEDDPTSTAVYSPSGSASAVEGALLSPGHDLRPAFRELTRVLAGLQGRRFGPGTDHADVRRALRASVSTGGAVLSVPRRERQRTAVRALLLVDVSRSVLDVVDRGFLIDFLRQARSEWRDTRVFLFDEEIREVTEHLDAPSGTAAMQALEAAEEAWGGGTRIGGSLATLRERHPEAVDRRTAVFLVSDGLEMGDVETLEREVSWLARRGQRVYWLNPLAAGDEYAPTARGMAAALPYLDGLFAFADPADVADMARQLRLQGAGGRVGYEFDSRDAANRRTTTGTIQT